MDYFMDLWSLVSKSYTSPVSQEKPSLLISLLQFSINLYVGHISIRIQIRELCPTYQPRRYSYSKCTPKSRGLEIIFWIYVVHLMLHTLIYHLYKLFVYLTWADGCTSPAFSCADAGASTVPQDLITMQHIQLSALTE